MNVSMQDGFNLGWKLGAVVTGLADAAHQERARDSGSASDSRVRRSRAPQTATSCISDTTRGPTVHAKVIYPGGYDEIDVTRVPAIFRPRTGPLHLTDWEKVFAAAPNRWNATDIHAERGISRDGAVVVVRPDQYVAGVFPLDGVDGVQELAVFFDAWLL